MESQALRTAVRRLREVVAPSLPPGGSDAELVRAFATCQDPAAFEQIVRRHGPMVLGVCRRVLQDWADADDAFQATFLVLIRKAGTLGRPDRLAGWLHQVAHRTARKLRAVRLTRQRRETELVDLPAGEPPAEIVWRELRSIFDAELDRLPDRLRLPAVLCLLEGYSKGDAARTLGWPEGTLSCRLQRARERLQTRLASRGLTLSVGALAAALFEGLGAAAVPNRLIESTLQGVANPVLATGARALADGVTQAMFLTKVKAVATAVLITGVLGTGTGVVLAPGSGPGEVVAAEPVKGVAPLPREGQPEPKKATDDPDRAIQRQELELLKERLAWEEKMVVKGFLPEAQVKETKLEVARAEAVLAKTDAPKPADARRKAWEATIQKMEQIVEQTRKGVEKGIVPLQELLNSEVTLERYKLQLLELDDRPPTNPSKVSAARRAAMEAIIQKVEEIAKKTEEGVNKGIVPYTELLHAQQTVLEYKFKLLELDDAATADQQAIPALKELDARIAQVVRALNRAEELLKEKAISQEKVRRLRIGLARLRAEAATAAGDYAGALAQREAVVFEWDVQKMATLKLAERKVASLAELRTVEVALATARVEALRAAVRKQLADIVAIGEAELKDARALFEAKAISAEELHQAERMVAEAKARLTAER